MCFFFPYTILTTHDGRWPELTCGTSSCLWKSYLLIHLWRSRGPASMTDRYATWLMADKHILDLVRTGTVWVVSCIPRPIGAVGMTGKRVTMWIVSGMWLMLLMLNPCSGLSLRHERTTHSAIHDRCPLDPVRIHAADNRSEIVFDVHAEGPVCRLTIIDVTPEAMRFVSNRVRSKKCFALELVM